MAGVVEKFLLASMLMWIIPVAVLYGFNHNVFPGSSDLSPHSLTLWSGLLAVISVNAVIGFYIYLAMKEPSDKHEPDPAFLAQARASVQKPIESTEGSSQPREKDE
ncbi:uncharacterized protein LOC115747018 [Rhodamnia argentea]|uniref:Vacuolar ATPase assembly integral membrane protein VMA21 homolog n=1 Tax=Rhodamnia argentea TaxID=178133 RepID=A0A8B8PVU5_9MYRT|nr:uncharacterized protein LOC115747018 [Rhodamnia argentea]XP_030538906.1 uncharacterized protein LOC115747018 [Rhodamnia argentea]XP_048132388.1 uncharacterized protein LOC115747018 [Rhodamnia argentea]XP_048132403.1 uncharacterized protein LOC115747018 [Rhodamnia argentea]XP_048132407.1 uncharacterized protein LOC115747018 [Rhodamnia argentea]